MSIRTSNQTARAAERSLDAQYYIWHDDFTGRLLASELGRATDRGVRVRVLVGDLDLRERHKFLAAVDRHPNLEMRVFNPFYSSPGSTLGLVGELLHRRGRLNHRMHNKAWIADNRVAIVGGRNVGDEYFGASEQVNFSDTGLVMGGPVVAQVSREFDEYWNSDVVVPVHALLPSSEQPAETGVESREAFSSLEAPRESTYAAALNDPDKLAEFLARRPPPLKVSNALVVADAPSKVESKEPGVTASRVLDAVLKVMNEAKSEILIVSPYFVPGESGASNLTAAEQRGVRVPCSLIRWPPPTCSACTQATRATARSCITDDKVSRYIVYQKEMNTVAGLVMGAATGAFAKSGGDQKQFEKALSADERTKKIADTEASALAKSGLTRSEVMEMVKIIAPYTPGATMGDDEMKKKAREEFLAKYGPEVLAVLERHLKELSALQDEMFGATLGGKKK